MMNAICSFFLDASVFLLLISVILVLWRLFRGPSLPDRVAAFDLFSILTMCLVAVFCFVSNRGIYLDVILALALMAFLGTLAFAQFIEWQLSQENHHD